MMKTANILQLVSAHRRNTKLKKKAEKNLKRGPPFMGGVH